MASFSPHLQAQIPAPAWQQAHLEAVWAWATTTVWGCPMGSSKSAHWRQAVARPRGLVWGSVLRGLRPWVADVPAGSSLGLGATDGHRVVLPSYLLLQYMENAEREKYRWSTKACGVDGFLWAAAHAALMHHRPHHPLPLEFPAQDWPGAPVVVMTPSSLDACLVQAGIVLPQVPALSLQQSELEWGARVAIEGSVVELGDEPANPQSQPVLAAWRKRMCDLRQPLAPWSMPWSQPFQAEGVELSVAQVKEMGLPFCVIPKEEEAPSTRFRCWNGLVEHPALPLSKYEWRDKTSNWPADALSFHLGQAVADNNVALAHRLLSKGATAHGHACNQMLFDVKDASLIGPLLDAGADITIDHHDAMGHMGVLEWACLSRPQLVPAFLSAGAKATGDAGRMPLSFRVAEYLCTRDEPQMHVEDSLLALEALQSSGHPLSGSHAIAIDRRVGGNNTKQSVDLLGWTLAQVALQRGSVTEDFTWLQTWIEGVMRLGVSATAVAPHLPVLHVLASQGRPGMKLVGQVLQRNGAGIMELDANGDTALHALCHSIVANTSSGSMDPTRVDNERLWCSQMLSLIRGLPDARIAFESINLAGQTPDAIVRSNSQSWQVFGPVWSEWAAEVRQHRLEQLLPSGTHSTRPRM